MKIISFFLAAFLLFFSLTGCGAKTGDADNDSDKKQKTSDTAEEETETDENGETGEDSGPVSPVTPVVSGFRKPDDFTVETNGGGTFSLKEALRDHDAVVINLWATWCGYCTMEFPYVEKVYRDYGDRVAFVALSIEPDDEPVLIEEYADDNELSFPMGSAVGTYLTDYAASGVPVTLVVDRNGYLTRVHLGAASSAREFTELFEDCLAPDYKTPAEATYTVYVYNNDTDTYVPDCTVVFCAGNVCVPVKTDANGVAVYKGAPADYTVSLADLPQGMGMNGFTAEELFMGAYSCTDYFVIGDTGE